jgi:tetratricopeptide (TPR) repeat protein
MTKKTDYQKKYWWLGAITVPIVVALIGQLTGIINVFKPPAPPAGNFTTNNMYLITQVFNTGEATQDAQQKIDNVIALTQSKNYADAIPLLEEVVAQYPLPAIYNNLGVLYALSGDNQKAQEAFQKALEQGSNNQAVNYNLGRFAESLGSAEEAQQYFSKAPDLYTPPATQVPTGSGPTVISQIPGVTARLIEFSRFQNTITLKVRLTNSSSNTPDGLCAILGDHLLDEATGKTYSLSDQIYTSYCGLRTIAANSSVDLWAKYSIPTEDHPQYLTAVLGYGILFEHLTLQ